MKLPSRRGAAVLIAAFAVALFLSGCSSTPDAPPPQTAQQIVSDLTAKIGTAKPGQVITAQNAPNKLLGRPGQYTSAAIFTDSRVPKDSQNPDQLSTDNGGKVEVFASEDEAKSRYDYIQGLAKQTPLAAEYDYLSGPVLVRVTKNLDPDAAKQYQDALGGR
ncbi:hypothetical protein [Actinomycetospora sp. CA-084318]|uniref:hypothetical protein n=1 Tax=Actinomycetospora sp. CA-084318 TaxID=3239892 RepID=UPI003D9760AF